MRQSLFTVVLVLAGLWAWQGPAKSWRAKHRCDELGESLLALPSADLKKRLASHTQEDVNYCMERWPDHQAPRPDYDWSQGPPRR